MLHLLKRHPIPISAFFRHSVVLTYAFPSQVLKPLLPAALVLDTLRDFAFLAVALVQTESLRPSFLPAALGRNFFLSGYRIFTRLAAGTQSKRGLRILRSDTDHPWMLRFGNLLTHYNYRLCEANLRETSDELHWSIRTPRAEADIEVKVCLDSHQASLPANSPFRNHSEARRFAGPLPYTFDYEQETNSIIGICASRQDWNPQPVSVNVIRNTFLDQQALRGARPILANAFHVQNVPYRWNRGRRLT
jgi:hypothetical protein